jgi:hypothetical protein
MRLAPFRTDRSPATPLQKRDDNWTIIDLHGKAPPEKISVSQPDRVDLK